MRERVVCVGGGGVKEEIAEGTRGCILGIQLNEAVCFLGNHLYRCQTTHPLTPPSVINEYSLSNKEAHIPTTLASPASFHTFFAAMSHVLKVVCVIGRKHLACECDIAVPFSHKLIKWILTETIAPVWICEI